MLYQQGQLIQSIITRNFYLILEEMTSFTSDEVSHFLKLIQIKPENDGTIKPFMVQIKPFMRKGLLTYKYLAPLDKKEAVKITTLIPVSLKEVWECTPLQIENCLDKFEDYLDK